MISRFFRGMGYFGRGWGTAFGAAGVTRWVLLPALVTVVVSGGGTWLAYRWAVDYIHRQSAGHGAIWGAMGVYRPRLTVNRMEVLRALAEVATEPLSALGAGRPEGVLPQV